MDNYYLVRPYEVGSKPTKCLAMVIPAALRKYANIDRSSILIAKIDEKTKQITLKNIDAIIERCEKMIPVDESLAASNQQASLKIQ
jgi:bifunctional DNA-binding transcriptional regulator/antitoxin component of YhaV-PrlF toxin-antitoxin module